MLEFKKIIIVFIFLIISLYSPSLLSADNVNILQEQAKLYREQGIEFQNMGRLNEAMMCYQKAITLDPKFVIAYNDLGIIYEAKGWEDKAEEIYLSALDRENSYPNLYSNLAMLYERKKEYKKAAQMWKKRIALGSSDEPWSKKAQERIVVLRELVPELMQEYLQEEADKLTEELYNRKRNKKIFDNAQRLYKAAQYGEALKTIDLLLGFNPENKEEVLSFRQEVETEFQVFTMEARFKNVMDYYRQNNLHKAHDELDVIAAGITSNLKK